jgi:adenosylcobinamide-GDP ribazoletransferase
LCVAAGARYPRPQGTGKAIVEGTRGWEALLFAALGGAAGLAAVPRDRAWTAPLLFLPALLAVLGLRGLSRRRLGGVTGDCLGAAIELAEALFLLAAVVFLIPDP